MWVFHSYKDKFQKRMSGKLLSHHSMNIYHCLLYTSPNKPEERSKVISALNTLWIEDPSLSFSINLSLIHIYNKGGRCGFRRWEGYRKAFAGDSQECHDRRGVHAGRWTLRFSDKGGERKDTQRGIGVHRQPLRGRGELQAKSLSVFLSRSADTGTISAKLQISL